MSVTQRHSWSSNTRIVYIPVDPQVNICHTMRDTYPLYGPFRDSVHVKVLHPDNLIRIPSRLQCSMYHIALDVTLGEMPVHQLITNIANLRGAVGKILDRIAHDVGATTIADHLFVTDADIQENIIFRIDRGDLGEYLIPFAGQVITTMAGHEASTVAD